MRHFYSLAFVAGLLTLCYAPSLFGDVTIDDFEYGYSCNWIGTYWYFLCDSNSTITGSYGSGNGSDSAGQMDFNVNLGVQFPMAYMGFNFDNALPPPPVDLTGATAVQFDIKASRSMDILFVLSQSTITDSITAMYSREIRITTSWTTVTVNLSTGSGGLSQLWGSGSFAIDKLTGLSWTYSPYLNTTNSYLPGTVWIDNVIAIGDPSELRDPYAPFIWGATMDDLVSFCEDPNQPILFIDEIARPMEPWYVIIQRIAEWLLLDQLRGHSKIKSHFIRAN